MYLYNSVLGDMLMRVVTELVDEICGRTSTHNKKRVAERGESVIKGGGER
jgi:hypothetical protein